MCTCPAIPVPHHAGWCSLPTQSPSQSDWAVFEHITLSDWADR